MLLAGRLKTDVPVLLKGGYSKRDQAGENPVFIVESVTPFVELRGSGSVAVALELPLGLKLAPDVLADLRHVVTTHVGSAPVEVRWSDGAGVTARLRSRSLGVAVTAAALSDLRAVLGATRVKLVRGS